MSANQENYNKYLSTRIQNNDLNYLDIYTSTFNKYD
jgi:hypothetical protein